MNKPGLIARLFGRNAQPHSVVAKLYSHAINAPLLVHPAIGERLLGAYLDGAVESPGTLASTAGTIAVINISGPMVNRPMPDVCGMGPVSYESIRAAIGAAISDSNVSAIVLRMDTCGGMAAGCFDLCDYIYASRGKKPIVAQVDDMAYSAGYAIASACDSIQVTRTAGVGSIGVVTYHIDQSQYDGKLGIKVTYIYSGDHKVDGNPHEPLQNSVANAMQADVDSLRQLFVTSVAQYRNMDTTDVFDTQADVYMGAEGVAIGLADSVGTLEDLLAKLSAPEEPAAPLQESYEMPDQNDIAPEPVESAMSPAEQKELARYQSQLADLTSSAIAAGKLNSKEFVQAGMNAKALHDLNLANIKKEEQAAAAALAAAAKPEQPQVDPEMAKKAAKGALAIALHGSTLSSDIVKAMLSIDIPEDQIPARIEQASAIADLCHAAKLDSCAGEFITRGVSLEQTRTELAAAVADTGQEVVTAIPAGGKPLTAANENRLDPKGIYDAYNHPQRGSK